MYSVQYCNMTLIRFELNMLVDSELNILLNTTPYIKR